MNKESIMYMALALFAGFVVTLQGPINTKLGSSLKSSNWAAFTTFIVGAIFYILYFIARKEAVPHLSDFKSAPYWSYIGGIFGAIYVLLVVLVTPRLGVGSTTILLLLAQIATSMIVDHFDLFHLGAKPIDLNKAIGIILVILGAIFINFGNIFVNIWNALTKFFN